MKQLFLIGLVGILLFSACQSPSDEEKLIGRWDVISAGMDEQTLEEFTDGHFLYWVFLPSGEIRSVNKYGSESARWEINPESKEITITNTNGETSVLSYTFSGKKMICRPTEKNDIPLFYYECEKNNEKVKSKDGADNFVGTWKCVGRCPYFKEITIKKNGDLYILDGTGFSNAHITVAYTLENGILKSSDPNQSDVAYGDENSHLYFKGQEYEKIY